MFRRRVASYDPKEDIEAIMRRLMGMDDKLDGILGHMRDEEDDEEEPD